jgi:hypothetical protein
MKMRNKKEIPKSTQDLIRTYAASFATQEQKSTLAGWLQLKFLCDKAAAVRYAEWWERQRL